MLTSSAITNKVISRYSFPSAGREVRDQRDGSLADRRNLFSVLCKLGVTQGNSGQLRDRHVHFMFLHTLALHVPISLFLSATVVVLV